MVTSPGVGELEGVAHQVEQHLVQPPFVAPTGGQVGRHVDAQVQSLGLSR
jgi:hypothetical protein